MFNFRDAEWCRAGLAANPTSSHRLFITWFTQELKSLDATNR